MLFLSSAKSSLSLHAYLFLSPPHPVSPYLSLPYPFLPPLLNRSLRQWLSQTRPPSWDQEEANAFLMRPRPQCDTVKWQESVAGEPLVQGIYHLKPSDPVGLWEGGRATARAEEGGRRRAWEAGRGWWVEGKLFRNMETKWGEVPSGFPSRCFYEDFGVFTFERVTEILSKCANWEMDTHFPISQISCDIHKTRDSCLC